MIAAKQKEFIPPPVLSKTQYVQLEGSSAFMVLGRGEAPLSFRRLQLCAQQRVN